MGSLRRAIRRHPCHATFTRVWVILNSLCVKPQNWMWVNMAPFLWLKEQQYCPLPDLEGHKALPSTSCPSTSEICLGGRHASQPSACQCLSKVEKLSTVFAQLWCIRAMQNTEDTHLLSFCKLFLCPTSLSPTTWNSLSVVFAHQVFCLPLLTSY